MRRVYLLFSLVFLGLSFSQNVLDLDALPLDLQDVAFTEHFAFEFYVEASPALATFTDQADEVYEYVTARMGVAYSGRIDVSVQIPSDAPCPVRGTMWLSNEDDESFGIIIFANETTGLDQLLGVLAHELGHLLHTNGFGEFPSTIGLGEGLASWAAGRYWLTWQQTLSLTSSVRNYIEQGIYLPLRNTFGFQNVLGGSGDTCLRRRDVFYTQWAAFTDYLIANYGVGRFKALLNTANIKLEHELGESKGVLPNYVKVYGQTLAQLEKAWLKNLGAV